MALTDEEKQGLQRSVCQDCDEPGLKVWEDGDCPFAEDCKETLELLGGIAERIPGSKPPGGNGD